MAYITISKSAFFYNLDIIAKKTKGKDKIAIVLKDNAYGHGLLQIARLSHEYGIEKAVVQKESEATLVASLFDYILILNDTPKEPQKAFCYTINSLEQIERFPKNTPVELKVDTGMHRNGIDPSQLHEAFARIQKAQLQLKAIFSHHRSADELTSEWFWQNENFQNVKMEAKKLAKNFNFTSLRFHIDNSASLFRRENFSEDMARVGIAAYGCMDLPLALQKEPLKPILKLYAKKIATKKLSKGARVGYGGAHRVTKDATLSTYDIGYGDGFFRSLSHNYITPDGTQIAGRISMDNSSFYSDENELLLFNDARDVAKRANTIAYEVLTSLKETIERKVVT